jgi:calcium/calmodulin-dependent protein kinase I
MGALLSHVKTYGSQECCSDIPSLLWLRRNSIAEASDASSSLIINNKEVSPPQEFLSKYVLCDEEIGVGSTSTVRIVIRRKDNVRFACKIIDKEVEATSNGNMIGMEVRVLKLLDHESIINLIDAFENIHHIFIVMHRYPGSMLYDFVLTHKQLREKDVALIIRRITEGVDYMHSMNVIHRDLRPENILIRHAALPDNQGEENDIKVKIIDFGLSKIIIDVNKTSSFVGSRSYLAPEMISKKVYDKSIDIWSLGVLAFVLLCGCLPFGPDEENSETPPNPTTVSTNTRRQFAIKFPPWSNNLSSSARDLLYNMLDVDPTRRYCTEQILQHPWISRKGRMINEKEADAYLPDAVLLNIARRKELTKAAKYYILLPNAHQANNGTNKKEERTEKEQQQAQLQEDINNFGSMKDRLKVLKIEAKLMGIKNQDSTKIESNAKYSHMGAPTDRPSEDVINGMVFADDNSASSLTATTTTDEKWQEASSAALSPASRDKKEDVVEKERKMFQSRRKYSLP